MLRLTAPLAILLATQSALASDTRLQFCWVGANGYTMEGQIAFPADHLNTGIITEADVTDFQIIGFLDGIAIGSWTMAERTPQTSFTLRFDTNTLQFPTGGIRGQNSYQEWNADGRVDNCGAVDGFGWNGGNYAQDVCINNRWIEASSIDPATPLYAQSMETRMICEDVIPLS